MYVCLEKDIHSHFLSAKLATECLQAERSIAETYANGLHNNI